MAAAFHIRWKQNKMAGRHNRNAKLTDEQVRQIRAEYQAGKRGKAESHRYGISPSRWNVIGRGLAWTHLKELN